MFQHLLMFFFLSAAFHSNVTLAQTPLASKPTAPTEQELKIARTRLAELDILVPARDLLLKDLFERTSAEEKTQEVLALFSSHAVFLKNVSEPDEESLTRVRQTYNSLSSEISFDLTLETDDGITHEFTDCFIMLGKHYKEPFPYTLNMYECPGKSTKKGIKFETLINGQITSIGSLNDPIFINKNTTPILYEFSQERESLQILMQEQEKLRLLFAPPLKKYQSE